MMQETPKRPVGRPRKEAKKLYEVSVRVDDSELAAWRAKAQAHGHKTMSGFIRKLMNEA